MLPGWGTDITLGLLTRSPPGSGRLLRPSGTGKRWRRRTAARPCKGLGGTICRFGDGAADLVGTVLLDEMHSAHGGFGQVGPAPDELADAPASRAMAKDAEGLRGLLGLASREVAIAGVRSVAVTASSMSASSSTTQ